LDITAPVGLLPYWIATWRDCQDFSLAIQTWSHVHYGRDFESAVPKEIIMITAGMTTASADATSKPSKFLTQLGEAARRYGHTDAAAEELVLWCRRFILFHGKKHPQEMGRAEIGIYLEHVAKTEADALRGIEGARRALEFLYGTFLQRQLGDLPLAKPPRLLDQVKQVMRVKHYALRTEECYTQWIKRFILFHGKRHPRDMGAAELELFLTDLAVQRHVSASTQNQALNAIVFLYRDVLELELGRCMWRARGQRV